MTLLLKKKKKRRHSVINAATFPVKEKGHELIPKTTSDYFMSQEMPELCLSHKQLLKIIQSSPYDEVLV